MAMRSGTATLENSLAISYKLNIYLPEGQAISLLEKQEHMFTQNECLYSSIYNCQKLETTHVSCLNG